MLLGSLYTITHTEQQSDTWQADVMFDPAHPLFGGHFPTMPVVPGVCQVQMLTEVTGFFLKKPVKLVNARHVKFLELLKPAHDVALSMEITVAEQPGGTYTVQAKYYRGEVVFFKFKGVVQ
jgi:3-hydroxyacyl-[acyl-carrier-protein] dehydratase